MTETVFHKAASKRWIWFIVAVVAIIVASGTLVLVVGALRDPTGSMHGMLGSAIWTTFGPHLFVFSLVCVVLSGLCFRRGPRYTAVVALMLSVTASLGAGAITLVFCPQSIRLAALLGDSAGGNLAINYSYAAAQGQLESDCVGDLPIPKAVIVQYPAVDPLAIYEHGFSVHGLEPKMLVRGYLGVSLIAIQNVFIA